MATSQSCYRTLDKSLRTIRLLILSPTLHPVDNRIQGSLIEESLESQPQYKALSYTWGKEDYFNFRIWVNGVLVPIRQNLLCALRVLLLQGHMVLWIDAICINQDDDGERGHQVAMMGDIYRNASRVLTWLGTPDMNELSDRELDVATYEPRTKKVLAFDLLKDASNDGGRFTRNTRDKSKGWMERRDWIATFLQGSYYDRHWGQLAELCRLGYWDRVWIIQEVILAPKLQLKYGTDSVHWENFRYVRNTLLSLGSSQRNYLTYYHVGDYGAHDRIRCSQPWKLDHQMLCSNFSLGTQRTLESLLEMSWTSVCQDKRDKIFGILGLAGDVFESDIAIDYKATIFDLYHGVMRFWAKKWQIIDQAEFLRCSTLLQYALVGPSFKVGNFRELGAGRQRYGRDNKRTEEHFKVKGHCVGVIEAVAKNPIELSQVLERQNFKGSGKVINWGYSAFLQSHALFREEDIVYANEIWSKTLTDAWSIDGDSFPHFLYTNSGNARGEDIPSGLVIFVTDSLNVGYGPKGMQRGDTLWKVDSGSQVAILNHVEAKWTVRGRARIVQGKPASWNTESRRLTLPRPYFDPNDPPYRGYGEQSSDGKPGYLEIDINLRALQALTCPLCYLPSHLSLE